MRQMTRQLLLTLLFLPAVLCASAQGLKVVKGDCTPGITEAAARGLTQPSAAMLRAPLSEWNPDKTYRQLVILVSYADTDFSVQDAKSYYDKLFNQPGYNEGAGKGCVADYYSEQSGGLFNLQFDIYGPFRSTSKARPSDNPTSSTRNYGQNVWREAVQQMITENPDLDYTQYDWDGDGTVEQVICIYAGIGGNQGPESYGYAWPNTSAFTTVVAPDGTKMQTYSSSAELWTQGLWCGIGTICHEFSHCLGLPDIYPTGGNTGYYSVADEWDLMDGGNFTNAGWCPPNFTAQEKMLMGWLTPTELTEPTTVTDLKAISDGGEAYIIKHTDNEYLLLENRQWTGWDAGVPGKGLVVYHVDYNKSAWTNNTVNTTKGHFRFDLVHADNMDYEQWAEALKTASPYAEASKMMHNKHLSTSPYPWTADGAASVNDELTDSSVPAATMFNENSDGLTLLGKAITNIKVTPEGLVSFDFMGGKPSAVTDVDRHPHDDAAVYNLMGQRVTAPGKGLVIRNGKKYIIH